MIVGMLWQCSGELDQQVEQAVAFAKSKYDKKAQRVDVPETAVKAETTIAGVVVRPSRLIQPGTLFVIWEGA
jgi:hypothetical protein